MQSSTLLLMLAEVGVTSASLFGLAYGSSGSGVQLVTVDPAAGMTK